MKKFEKLIFDVKNGIKRKISSRRLKMEVSIEDFRMLSKKYFLKLKKILMNLNLKLIQKTRIISYLF